jgi:glycosyltransferase involved in cell wall biosynthesis
VGTVSIVIPCLNGAATLADQLDGIAAQKWSGQWEIVVADNGSTDDSAAIALSYSDRVPTIRVVDASSKRGAPAALNVGVGAAKSDYILILDADDQVAPGYLAAMVEGLDQHDVVAARYDFDTLNPSMSTSGRGQHQVEGLMSRYGYLPYAGCGGLGFRREAFELVGGFDSDLLWLFEIDFCWQAQQSGLELAFLPEAVVRVRFRESEHDVYRQARNWASAEPDLYRRYRSLGMVRSPTRTWVKEWLRLIVRVYELAQPDRRKQYLRGLGQCVGRLQGSWTNHVFFP